MYKLKYQHKTNGWIALTVFAALSLSSCSGEGDEPDSGNGNSIVFGAYISDAYESRASVANIDDLKKAGFGVFASNTGADDFNPDATVGFTSDFMYNQKVWWKAASSGAVGAGSWAYDQDKSWPRGKVSFFAYAPHAATLGETGITGITGEEVSGSPKVTFKMDSDVDKQIDLLYADAETTVNLEKVDQVQFNFRHALTRVGFRIVADEVIDAATTLTINSVVFKSSSLGSSGDLNLASGRWENMVAEEMEYPLATEDFIAGSNVITHADGTKMSNLTANGKYLMLIPSNKAVPVAITVNYDVATVDANLAAGGITINNEITSTFEFNFETGKAYWFTLRLGLKSVDVDPVVTDWEESETDWKPEEKQ